MNKDFRQTVPGKSGILLLLFIFLAAGFAVRAQRGGAAVFEGNVGTLVFEDKKGTKRHYLDTGDKMIFFSPTDKNLPAGRVSITGRLDAENALAAEKIRILDAPKTVSTVPVAGLRTTLILLLNFQNNPVQPVPVEEVRSRVFTDAKSPNQYFQQASGGRLRLVGREQTDGDVFGYFTIPFTNENCSANGIVNEWAAAADEIALNNGINADLYNSVVYLFAGGAPDCDVAVFGDMPAIGDQTTQRVYFIDPFNEFNNQFFQYYVAHEIGHNLGLNHVSGFTNCPTNVPVEACSGYVEYADRADIMGNFGYHLLNNYNRLRLGWLPGKVSLYDAPGAYYLNLHSPNQQSKRTTAAQIRLKDSSGNFTQKSAFLEFRRGLPPFDIFMSGEFPFPPVQLADKGVTIRIGNENLFDRLSHPYVIDATPETPDFGDAALTPGQNYTNSYYGISITTLSTNPFFGARVKIELTR